MDRRVVQQVSASGEYADYDSKRHTSQGRFMQHAHAYDHEDHHTNRNSHQERNSNITPKFAVRPPLSSHDNNNDDDDSNTSRSSSASLAALMRMDSFYHELGTIASSSSIFEDGKENRGDTATGSAFPSLSFFTPSRGQHDHNHTTNEDNGNANESYNHHDTAAASSRGWKNGKAHRRDEDGATPETMLLRNNCSAGRSIRRPLAEVQSMQRNSKQQNNRVSSQRAVGVRLFEDAHSLSQLLPPITGASWLLEQQEERRRATTKRQVESRGGSRWQDIFSSKSNDNTATVARPRSSSSIADPPLHPAPRPQSHQRRKDHRTLATDPAAIPYIDERRHRYQNRDFLRFSVSPRAPPPPHRSHRPAFSPSSFPTSNGHRDIAQRRPAYGGHGTPNSVSSHPRHADSRYNTLDDHHHHHTHPHRRMISLEPFSSDTLHQDYLDSPVSHNNHYHASKPTSSASSSSPQMMGFLSSPPSPIVLASGPVNRRIMVGGSPRIVQTFSTASTLIGTSTPRHFLIAHADEDGDTADRPCPTWCNNDGTTSLTTFAPADDPLTNHPRAYAPVPTTYGSTVQLTATQQSKWLVKFNQLLDFKQLHGHCRVPIINKLNNNASLSPSQKRWAALSQWVKRQRLERKRKHAGNLTSSLTDEREQLLDDVEFVWDTHRDAWDKRLAECKKFLQEHGSGYIPVKYSANPSLASWAKNQRRHYRRLLKGQNSCLTLERVNDLNRIGFVWDWKSHNHHDERKRQAMMRQPW